MSALILTAGELAFLDGLLEDTDEFSDSAWPSACVDIIAAYQQGPGDLPLSQRVMRADPWDVWSAWVAATSVDAQEVNPNQLP